jgi:hypothetical protein
MACVTKFTSQLQIDNFLFTFQKSSCLPREIQPHFSTNAKKGPVWVLLALPRAGKKKY